MRRIGKGEFGVVTIMKRLDFTYAPLYVDKELMILASLTNANVIHLYQYSRGRDDSFFFLMECIDGGSFDDIIEKTITLTISLMWSYLHQIVRYSNLYE